MIDLCSRRTPVWRAASSNEDCSGSRRPCDGDLDSRRHGTTGLSTLIHHHDAGGQHLYSLSPDASPQRVPMHRSAPSRGLRQCSSQSSTGLLETELIKPRGPWRTCDQVEIATWSTYWYHHRRCTQQQPCHQPTFPSPASTLRTSPRTGDISETTTEMGWVGHVPWTCPTHPQLVARH